MNCFVIFVSLLIGIAAKSLPPSIKKCSKSDPNLNKCLDTNVPDAVQILSSGNKELGIVPLEPFFIKTVDLGNSSSGAVSLHQVYNNMKMYGIVNATIRDSDASFTDVDCHWKFKAHTPLVRMESDYEMKGQLLIFPINGHGKCENLLYDIESEYDAKCEKYTKKNKTYFRVTDFIFKIRPKRIVFNFENIIDGNEQLSKEVVKTLNENSDEVYADVGPAFEKVMGLIWKQTINQVFIRVPEDELFLP